MMSKLRLKSFKIVPSFKGKIIAFVQIVTDKKEEMFTEIGEETPVKTVCDLIQKITGFKFKLIDCDLKIDDSRVVFQLEDKEETRVSVFGFSSNLKDPLAVLASNLLAGINSLPLLDLKKVDFQAA
jgi:hypothetical protein